MGSCELEHRSGRWLAPAEFAGLLEEVYDTLLRQRPSAGDSPFHIVLGCHDSDREICCATERSRLAGRPFASTEEQAKEKLWMWLKKQASASTKRRPDTDADPVTTSPVVTDCTAGSPATTDSAVCDATDAPSADTSLQSGSVLLTTEVEAVEWLRTRGYVIAPPYASPNGPQNVGPPPSYLEHVPISMSMSQPLPGTVGRTDASAVLGEKRKRIDDLTAETTTTTATLPAIHTASKGRTSSVNGGSRTTDGDTDEDDVVVVSAPLRKKRGTIKTKGRVRKSPPQRPSTPPCRTKTKKTALSSVVSYEEAADLTGVDVRAFDPVRTMDVEGDEGDGTTAEEGHLNMEVDSGEHRTNGDRTAEPTEICLGGLHLADASPPTSSPEEEVVASSLLALRHSTPTASFVEAAVDDGRDGLEGPDLTSKPGGPVLSEEELGFYQDFYKDVKAAEERSSNPKTLKAMADLWRREPLLYETFLKCLSIARATMGEDVCYRWRRFREQGRRKREQHGSGIWANETTAPDHIPSAAESTTEAAVVAAAYHEFQEAIKAETNEWKARFQYRRASARLFVQYQSYSRLYREQHGSQTAWSMRPTQRERSILLRSLFREMNPDWRRVLQRDFTEKQAKEQGYASEWNAFNLAIRDGKRWSILVDALGSDALLLIDTSGRNTYIQRRIPMPVFVAWVALIPKVVEDLEGAVENVRGDYEGIEDPSYIARRLRFLKLEHLYNHALPAREQFDYSGSEGRKTPTADPGLLTYSCHPSVSGGASVDDNDDFIDSSGVYDEDLCRLTVVSS